MNQVKPRLVLNHVADAFAMAQGFDGVAVGVLEHGVQEPLALMLLQDSAEPGQLGDLALVPEPHALPVYDARAIADSISLDREGFALVRQRSAVKDFYNDDEVRSTYYPEAERLIRDATGASRVFIEKMVEGFGLTSEVKAKTMLAPGSVGSNELVRDGKSEMIFTLVSEILPAPGVELVGPLPTEVQSYISFAAAVSAKPSSVSSIVTHDAAATNGVNV